MDESAEHQKESFAELIEKETIRRALRKTAGERVASLMSALEYSWKHGMWPIVDRKAKEQRLLCLFRQKSSPPSTSTGLNT